MEIGNCAAPTPASLQAKDDATRAVLSTMVNNKTPEEFMHSIEALEHINKPCVEAPSVRDTGVNMLERLMSMFR